MSASEQPNLAGIKSSIDILACDILFYNDNATIDWLDGFVEGPVTSALKDRIRANIQQDREQNYQSN